MKSNKLRSLAVESLDVHGIATPEQIDVERIATAENVEIRYARLEGCAANLIGLSDRAIITVDESSSRARARFSIAHELGHKQHNQN